MLLMLILYYSKPKTIPVTKATEYYIMQNENLKKKCNHCICCGFAL